MKRISEQLKAHSQKEVQPEPEPNWETGTISTGSTLLDLAISGEVTRGGGLPGGILTEIFGPAGCGKTVMLCEIAGGIQRQGGQVWFNDPEARLNKSFASIFGVTIDDKTYAQPNTVTGIFTPVRESSPDPPGKIHGVMADSLAALLSEMEAAGDDKMGTRRALEFSIQLRKTCRVIPEKNILMVCSNQLRQNIDGGQFAPRYKSTGGEAIGFYASLRLRCKNPQKIKLTKKIHGRDVEQVIGVQTEVYVEKSTIGKPYRTAPITIIFDYGVDDIRQNLHYVKFFKGHKVYQVGDQKLSNGMDHSIHLVEKGGLQKDLREEVIDLWEEIAQKFQSDRQPKHGGSDERQEEE